MHIAVTTVAGRRDFDVPPNEVPAGYNAENIAHVFADAIDGNTTSRQIVQHTAPTVWTAINSDHVVTVDVSD